MTVKDFLCPGIQGDGAAGGQGPLDTVQKEADFFTTWIP